MGLAQRGDGGQRVENVAHGSQTDHEQAELGLHMQNSIFSQGRVGKIGSQPQLCEEPIERGVFEPDAETGGLQGQIGR
jgi:hypothetical protein